ncbi:MAG: VWA domain-containing protein [Deltaproteobacteria bacterium]|nr:MAG: VWA domain-containing protein [Deltaproteobacteria bacterium]
MAVVLSYRVAEAGSKVYVLARVAIGGDDGTGGADRTPVNLALVVDQSSSMRGPRFAQAVRAVREVASRLDARDRLALVLFDGTARVAFGPAPLSDDRRAELAELLDAARTGIGTNLAAGWKKGVEAVASGFVRGAIARVVLLTDGQPSVGITDASRLAELAEAEAARGVTTTCMGIGETFDDELLGEIARRGGGGFYFLERPESIPAAFGSELAGVFAIGARQAELKLVPDEDVVSVEVLHRLPARPAGDGLVVHLGDVAGGPPRQVLFCVHREPGTASRRVGTLALTCRNADGSPGDGHILGVELPPVPLHEDAAAVILERLRLVVASAVDEAWARRGHRDRRAADGALARARREVADARAAHRLDPAAVDELLDDIARAERALAGGAAERERARRGLRERSQLTLLGHSSVRPLPEADDDTGAE